MLSEESKINSDVVGIRDFRNTLRLGKHFGSYFNNKIRKTFGLAWTQSEYDDLKELTYNENDFAD